MENKRKTGKTAGLRRGMAFVLSLMLVCLPMAAYAGVYGEDLAHVDWPIGGSTMLSQDVYWNSNVSDKVTENYITYTPGNGVVPLIHYGHDIYGAASLKRAVELAQQDGYRIAAAINGDFFDMNGGVTMGTVIKEGVLRTSGTQTYGTIGFHQNGTAFIDTFDLAIRADGETLGYGIGGMHLNKKMTVNAGAILYSTDFEATNKATIPTVNVVMGQLSGVPKVNSEITAVVESVGTATGATAIKEGTMVLSMASETPYKTTLGQLSALQPGDEITLSFTASEKWSDVTMAIGGESRLLSQGQNVAKSSSRDPRTALGIKPDGTVVLYTVDGRKSGHSVGATLSQVAERLLELGCTEAINLDGGGSTMMQAVRIGDDSLVTVNTPSEGSLRSCGNYILLANQASKTGELGHVQVYPRRLVVLSGAIQTFSVKAVDTGYYSMNTPSDVTYETTGGIGTIDENGLFTAGPEAASGAVRITAGGCTDTAAVTVVRSPGYITVSREDTGKSISSLTLKPGESVDLTASSYWNHQLINAADYHYTWNVSGDLGTIDEKGKFTAGEKAGGTGTITVSSGSSSVSIALKVKSEENPFVDMQGHWAEKYAGFLYEKGVIQGNTSSAGLTFRPDANLTRAEFAVMMSNWLVPDTGSYAETELPFKDCGMIPAWALNSVKAMYAKGVLQGSGTAGNLRFNPNQSISRQEVMTILGRTQPVDEAAPALNFADAGSVADWALPYVKTMVGRAIVSGMPDGNLHPNGLVTRAQVLKMIYGLYE